MRGPATWVVSVAVHAVALTIVAGVAPRTERERRRPEPRDPSEPAAEPIELTQVVFLDDEPQAPASTAMTPPIARPAKAEASTSIASVTGATSESPAAASIDIGGPPGVDSADGNAGSVADAPGVLRMRGADLALGAEALERIAGAGGPVPGEVRRSGRIEPMGSQGVIRDAVVTVTVHGDGTVDLASTPEVSARVDTAIHLDVVADAKRFGRSLSAWYADPGAGGRFGRSQDLPAHLQAVPGACDEWGAAMCDDPLAPGIEQAVRDNRSTGLATVSGSLDLTALIMRKVGLGDPYGSRKQALLDATREERIASGTVYRADQRERSAELALRNVQRLWSETASLSERKAALFALWDECNEDEDGERARRMILGFIRARLPAGSADAYSETEIAALEERRTSAQHFAPYE